MKRQIAQKMMKMKMVIRPSNDVQTDGNSVNTEENSTETVEER